MIAKVDYNLFNPAGSDSDEEEENVEREEVEYDSDDAGSMESTDINMANAKINWDEKDHKIAVPADYLELQRHFCALYPRHDVLMTIEREGGTTVPPWETRFMNGEVIVFREYTLPDKYAEKKKGPHTWEVGNAQKMEKLRPCWER